ncbi:MAG: hypothetical protein EP297_04940 [Gammaproteobacteria bacterium]|nr:MAG: hypothetical protein EP297_04940 [Gammaproteobacteria bacterium]
MGETTQIFHLKIPEDIQFTDLDVKNDPETNKITINAEVIDHVLVSNKIDIEELDGEGFLGSILLSWYEQWLAAGGESNPIMEQMRSEIAALV